MLQAIIAGIVTFILTLVGIPAFIRFYHKAHISGQQMHEDVKQHQAKAGTPTMGGTVFLLASVLSSFVIALISRELSSAALMILFILVLYGIVGFLDDFLKIFRKINEGLNPKQKLVLQIIGGIVFYFFFDTHGGGDLLNVFGFPLHLGYLYIAFALFWLVGFSNAVNLTDGIDGLASISVTISLAAYAVIATVQHRFDILIVILSMIGGLLAFFIFNHKPAKIFMGDMGSLALGGALAAVSLMTHHELALLVIGFVFVMETASVILQVASFKLTGKRIFKMSPIHHHFEMCGWSEWRIDITFWCIGIICSAIALAFIL